MKSLIILIIVTLLVAMPVVAIEKKPFAEIDTSQFTSDTQIMYPNAGEHHLALVWWIPYEFWETVLSQDSTTSEADKQSLLDTLTGFSLLAIIQADISNLGAFTFFTKEEIEKNLRISFTDAAGKTQQFAPMQSISSDLEVVLGVFKPLLGAAMGNMGDNFHFYVLDDSTESLNTTESAGSVNDSDSADPSNTPEPSAAPAHAIRKLDPYQPGLLDFHLKKKDGNALSAQLELPLNCLFVPRKCPNGKDAHITWTYCPWTGEKLKD